MPGKSQAVSNVLELQKARPFLKWVGGKRQLINELLKGMPEKIHSYHEPFIGGGALFFELAGQKRFKKTFLSDLNAELINAYIVVQSKVEELIQSLKKHVHSKEYYYRLRAVNPETLDEVERASRLIYLNKTCYNGLYRVNSKGRFNVPFGSYKNPKICDKDNLRLCSEALKGVSIRRQSFDAVLRAAKPKDFIYFDPPYHPVSKTSSFSAYEKSGFGEVEQKRLRDVFVELDRKDCFVMLSNSYSDFTLELYHRYAVKKKLQKVHATRAVNSKSSARGAVREIIVRNF